MCTLSRSRQILVAVLLCLILALAAAADVPQTPPLRILTYNVYQGTDFGPVLAFLASGSTDPSAFAAAVGASLQQVVLSDPNARAQATADQIQRAKPDIVVMQEDSTWNITPLGFDFVFLDALTSALQARKQPYTVAVEVTGFQIGPLPALGLLASLVNHNLVLVRTDLNPAEVTFSNVQTGNYAVALPLPIPGSPVFLTRNWISLDVSYRGKSFRFFGTHLEAFDATVAAVQAGELLLQAGTTGAVVLAGDFNADSNPAAASFAVYATLLNSAFGFSDAWEAVHPFEPPGLTCCQAVDDNLLNFMSQLNQRIDHVFVRGTKVVNARLIGNEQSAKTPGGLWPSDHAGLLVEISLQ